MPQEERVRIADRFTAIPVGADEVRLHSLNFSLALSGRSTDLLVRLLPLLDGAKTVAEVAEELNAFGEDAVRNAIGDLLRSGAVERVEADDAGSLPSGERRRFREQIAFFSHFIAPADAALGASHGDAARSGAEYQQRIREAHVCVFGAGRLGSQLIRSLGLAGVGKITAVDAQAVGQEDLDCDAWFGSEHYGANRAAAAGALCAGVNPAVEYDAVQTLDGADRMDELLRACDFAVLCPDHFNPAEYQAFNRAALVAKTSWTSARLAGFEFHMGPTVMPSETACFECFTSRLKSNSPDYAEYVLLEEYLKKDRLRPATLAITPGIGLLALEVLKALTWFVAPSTYAHLYTLDLLTLKTELHPVLKIPRCPACGRSGMPRPTVHVWQQSTVDLPP